MHRQAMSKIINNITHTFETMQQLIAVSRIARMIWLICDKLAYRLGPLAGFKHAYGTTNKTWLDTPQIM